MLEQISEWQLGGILVLFSCWKLNEFLTWLNENEYCFSYFFRCLDSSVYTCTTARYMNCSVWNMMNRTTYLFSFPCPNIHMQPYKIQPRIYRGFTHVSDYKDWPLWGNFPSHRQHVGNHTSREEIKDITLEHMTHITSILQVTTLTASS